MTDRTPFLKDQGQDKIQTHDGMQRLGIGIRWKAGNDEISTNYTIGFMKGQINEHTLINASKSVACFHLNGHY